MIANIPGAMATLATLKFTKKKLFHRKLSPYLAIILVINNGTLFIFDPIT